MRSTPHIPERTCVGCGRRAPRSALMRFVARGDGLALDLSKREHGRGAYLHDAEACRQGFVGRKPPLRSLRRSFARPQREALIEELREGWAR